MSAVDVSCCMTGSVTLPCGQCLACSMIVKFVVF